MVPALPDSWRSSVLKERNWIETRTAFSPEDIKDFPALATWLKTKPDPVAEFVNSQLSRPMEKINGTPSPAGDPAAPVTAAREDSSTSVSVTGAPAPPTRSSDDTISMLADYKEGSPVDEALKTALLHDLNRIIRQEIGNKEGRKDNKPVLFDPQRYGTVRFSQKTLDQAAELASKDTKSDHAVLRLNRLVLQDALPSALPYHDSVLAISDQGASFLSSIAFGCFLLGRISGAWLLKRFSAHKTLGLYALLNVGVCFLIISQLGWVSVLCVFVSYFFMSIMFPTIFAVGIYGLGSQSKKKASAFIVMSITGGALMPKFMGYLGDVLNMSSAFWMPLGCFILIALYALMWPKLSGHESLSGLQTTGGH
jgi:hypothetical protein